MVDGGEEKGKAVEKSHASDRLPRALIVETVEAVEHNTHVFPSEFFCRLLMLLRGCLSICGSK
jgi:hypothetical protein